MSSRGSRDPNETLETALAILEAGVATIDELRQANDFRHAQRPKLGKLAMTHGKLSMAQVFAILGEQVESGKLFGEQAVEMGFLDKGPLLELLLIQADLTPTLADALVTLAAITPEQASFVLKQIGALPQCDPVYAETACY